MDLQASQIQKRAVELALGGESDSAEYLFLHAVELESDESSYAGLGWFYGLRNRPKDAMRCFRRGLEINSQSGELCNEIAVFLLRRKRNRAAIQWLNRALRSAPDTNRHLVLYNLGLAFRRLNRPERTRRYLKLALRSRPNFAEAAEFLSELDPVT